MRTVAIASQKGGSGKTTLAVGLAVAAVRAGMSTLILDLDPQCSASVWADRRKTDHPTVTSIQAARLAHALRAAEGAGADLILIDTAPAIGDAALAAAQAADMILIPCRPALFDIAAIGATAGIAKLAERPAVAILNAVSPGATRLVDDARQAVAAHGLAIAPIVISQRAAYAHALTAGLSAEEFEPSGRAADEIKRLYRWLSGELMPS